MTFPHLPDVQSCEDGLTPVQRDVLFSSSWLSHQICASQAPPGNCWRHYCENTAEPKVMNGLDLQPPKRSVMTIVLDCPNSLVRIFGLVMGTIGCDSNHFTG